MLGLIGAGSIALALARGLAAPVVCTDAGSGRAKALVAEMGGVAAADNSELAAMADIVILCHQPARLEAVAAEFRAPPKVVVSLLSSIPLDRVERAYPDVPVFRFAVTLPIALRRGLICYAGSRSSNVEREREILRAFSVLGSLIRVDEGLLPAIAAVANPALL